MATRPAKATGTRNPRNPQRARKPAQGARPPAQGARESAQGAKESAQGARKPAQRPRPSAESAREPAQGAAPPRALRLAAAVQLLEAVGICVAAVFAATSTADGRSYQMGSGVALTLIAVGLAAVFVVFAAGLARAKPWTRTPVVMTQLFVIIAGITLLDGHRPEWGVPALLLAACCLGALFTPASLRALNRPYRRP
jgi:hypothetical protein